MTAQDLAALAAGATASELLPFVAVALAVGLFAVIALVR